MKAPIKGFISAPKPEQLKPTAREQHLLGVLWDWERQGSRSQYVPGQKPAKSKR